MGTIDRTTSGDLSTALLAPVKLNILGRDGSMIGGALNQVPVDVSSTDCTAADNPQQSAPEVMVSARPKVDFRKDQPDPQRAITYNGQLGYLVGWYVYADQYDAAGATNKGGEPVIGPVTLLDQTTNFPPNAVWYGCEKLEGQGTITCPAQGTPVVNGVAGTGNIVITPQAGEGNQFLIRGGLNTAIQVDPNTPRPDRLFTVVARFFVPVQDILDAGGQINLANDIPASQIRDGNGNIIVDPRPAPSSAPNRNNGLPVTVLAGLSGVVSKWVARSWYNFWSGSVPGTTAPTLQLNNADFWGDPGTGLVFPGQYYYPRLSYRNPSVLPATNVVLCESFNSGEARVADVPGPATLFPPSGHGAGDESLGVIGTDATRYPQGFTIAYGVSSGVPTSGAGSRCDDADAVWYPTLTAAQAAGDRERINRVRMTMPELAGGATAYLTVAQQIRPGVNGTVIEDYASWRGSNLRGTGGVSGDWLLSSYDPVTNNGVGSGKRFTLTGALARIAKEAAQPAEPATNVNNTVAGSEVLYKLTPSLFSEATGIPPTSVTIVDTLPAPVQYVAGSSQLGGANLAPDSVVTSATNTVVTWTINNVSTNTPIPTLTFRAFVPETMTPNTDFVNTATISSPIDSSPVNQRTATKALTVLNPPGIKVFKGVDAPMIEPNGSSVWKLQIANFENTATTLDVIDVLPYAGDGRSPPTAYNGVRPLAALLSVPSGSTALYSSRPSASVLTDPQAVGNTPVAANGWCSSSEFGNPGCPTGLADVTALRIIDLPIVENATIEVQVAMTTNGNVEDDVYSNRFFAKAASVPNTLRSNDATVTVALGSLSGRVYYDENRNAVQDGANEVGLPAVALTLCRVNVNPCPSGSVAGTTSTDASGNYRFDDLLSGPYSIFETQPNGYISAPANVAGSAGGAAAGPDAFTGISLAVGANGTNYNFGEFGDNVVIGSRKVVNTAPVPVAGQNGVFDVPFRVVTSNLGNVALNGVTVTDTVCGPGGTFADANACAIQVAPVVTVTGSGTTATTAGAAYTGLAAGNNLLASGAVLRQGGEISIDFTVRVTLGSTLSFNNSATSTGTPANGSPVSDVSNDGPSFTGGGDTDPTGPNSNNPTPVRFASLQGRVFVDQNRDGDPAGEAPIVGVTITISDGGLTAPSTVTTDANGNYAVYVPVSNTPYTIVQTQPAGYDDGRDQIGTAALDAGAAAGTPLAAPSSNGGGAPAPGTGNGIGADSYTSILANAGGTIYGNFNFGETQLAPISGRVYRDTAGDGVNDGTTADPGIGSVALTLCRTAGVPCAPADVVATTTTNPDGTYTFPDVLAGDYFVQETQPSTYGTSTVNVVAVTRTANTPVTNVDFGETLGRIAGFVYADSDDSGVRDGADSGISGVTVTLTGTDANGAPVSLSATTQADGGYVIDNVPVPQAGTTYTLTETPGVPAGYNNGSTNIGTPNFSTGSTNTAAGIADAPNSIISGIAFTPPTGPVLALPVDGVNYNFGELQLGDVSGRVYLDTDVDGANDGVAADPGIGGVTMTLCRTAGVPCVPADVVATTTTNSDGTYTFPNVPAGSYFVQQTQDPTYGSTTTNALPVTRTGATSVTNVDFGETLGRIAGFVYADNDNSSLRDGADSGIGGITVTLTGTDANGAPVNLSATTQPDGSYVINSVPAPQAGTAYTLTEAPGVPAGYSNGATNVGTPNFAAGSTDTAGGTANTPTSSITGIAFTPATSPATARTIDGTDYNFGELALGGISGRVYLDTGTNGANDGTATDPGIGSTTITLCRSAGVPCAPDDVVATTASAADGTYNFPAVPTGNYFVQETQPSIYGSSTVNVVPVTRVGTTNVINVDFGETTATIAGHVYQDNDQSGTRNAGDVGIGSVTVTLTGSDANGNPVLLTTTTQLDGSYAFNNVPAPGPNGFTIAENQSTVPPNLSNGSTNVGTITPNGGASAPSGTEDSPASTITGITWTPPAAPATAPHAVGANYDFGELPLGNISGRVYLDTNTDGGNDGLTTDPGIGGIAITLCRSAGVPCAPGDIVATTTTNPDGTYELRDVPAGSYFVQETQTPIYGSSTPNVTSVTRSGANDVTNVDFGETGATVGGYVYQDNNQNGTRDSGDIGIGGVTVTLTGIDANGNSVSLTATSQPDGRYVFEHVPAPGASGYTVTENQSTVPAGLINGTTNVGTIVPNGGAATSIGTANTPASTTTGLTWSPPAAPVAAPNTVGADYNFGEILGANLSGNVIRDTDRDGVRDSGEIGIGGVTITLCRSAGVPCAPADVVATTTTGSDGSYSFVEVSAGNYFIQETQPASLGSSPGFPNVIPVTMANADITNQNFLDMPAQLSGTVYRDNNNDGQRNAGEPGIAGITVTLTGTDAGGNPVSRTTTTDANGNYVFADLPAAGPGGYIVVEASQPPQTGDSASNVGGLVDQAGSTVTTGVGTSVDRNTIATVVLPPGGEGTNYLFGDVPNSAGVSGTVWRDSDHDRNRDSGEEVVPNWTVQLIRTDAAGNNPVVIATVTTDANGQYSFTNLIPGPNYQIVFRSPDARDATGQPVLFGTPVDGEQGTGTAPIPPTIGNGIIQNLTLVADILIPQQSLPLDPGGVVYDAMTRQPVPGAVVTLQGPSGFNPATHLVGGTSNASQTVGATGQYQFVLVPGAPAGTYTINVAPPSGYSFPSTILPVVPGSYTPSGPAGGVALVAPQPGAPQVGTNDPTTYYLSFILNPGTSPSVVNNHIPLDPQVPPRLFISKVGDRNTAELGDSVRYTIRIRRVDSGGGALATVTVFDSLPAGFRYIAGTAMLNGASQADPAGAPGPGLTFTLLNANLAANQEITLTYRVRLGVGAAQGSGINRAQAAIGADPNCAANPQQCSNEAQFRVRVTEGVFTSEGCVAGKIYMDCNLNQTQDGEELGIPGVRLYFGDGTYLVSDSEGKYSYCGLKPMTHVLKVDPMTLPKGSRLTTTSNRNAGDANSLFVDLTSGELHRADFAEGSCSNTVLEQVKARRSQGEVRSVENESRGRAPLKFEGRSSDYPQHGTDSADQPAVKPREPAPSMPPAVEPRHENDLPINQLPASSGNTTGARTSGGGTMPTGGDAQMGGRP